MEQTEILILIIMITVDLVLATINIIALNKRVSDLENK